MMAMSLLIKIYGKAKKITVELLSQKSKQTYDTFNNKFSEWCKQRDLIKNQIRGEAMLVYLAEKCYVKYRL